MRWECIPWHKDYRPNLSVQKIMKQVVLISPIKMSKFIQQHFIKHLSGKESCNAGGEDSIPGWEDPLEEGMATHPSILAWRIPWTEKPSRLQFLVHKESDRTEATWHINTVKTRLVVSLIKSPRCASVLFIFLGLEDDCISKPHPQLDWGHVIMF